MTKYTVAFHNHLVNPAYDWTGTPIGNSLQLSSNNAKPKAMSVNSARPTAGSNILTTPSRKKGGPTIGKKRAKALLREMRASR